MKVKFARATAAYDAGDYITARQIWEKLAVHYNFAAMRNLGHIFRNGLGVERDFTRARKYYQQAAEYRFAPAQYNLAMMYLRGEGIKADPARGLFWMQKSAEGGFRTAQIFIQSQKSQKPQN